MVRMLGQSDMVDGILMIKIFSSGNIRRKGMVTFKVYVIDLFAGSYSR